VTESRVNWLSASWRQQRDDRSWRHRWVVTGRLRHRWRHWKQRQMVVMRLMAAVLYVSYVVSDVVDYYALRCTHSTYSTSCFALLLNPPPVGSPTIVIRVSVCPLVTTYMAECSQCVVRCPSFRLCRWMNSTYHGPNGGLSLPQQHHCSVTHDTWHVLCRVLDDDRHRDVTSPW